MRAQCITEVGTNRGTKTIIRVYPEPVAPLLQLQKCNILGRNTVGRITPTRDTGQRLILAVLRIAITRGLKITNTTRCILVLVHPLNNLWVPGPTLKRIKVCLV